MSTLRWKWAMLVIVLGVFAYYLLPTVRFYSMDPERAHSTDPSVASIRENAMRLGLDLQGGSYLVYEVDLSKLTEEQRTGDEVERAIEIIRNRVDAFGVTEPIIQKLGENRIVVQLPGLQEPERAKELVGKTARLEFRIVKNQQELFQAISVLDKAWARRLKGQAVSDSLLAGSDTTAAADTTVANETPFSALLQSGIDQAGIAYCPDENYDEANEILEALAMDNDRPKPLAGGTVLLWGESEFVGTANPGRYLYAMSARPELTGDRVSEASVAFGLEAARPNAAGVSMTFDRRGAGIFTRVTGNNVGRQLGIVLDNKVKSAPVIRDKIRGGTASITGLDNDQEAQDLAIVLRAGALPTDLLIQEERTVGPSLGRDSIRQGVQASMWGLGLVVVLMLIYYRASGILAVLALALNLFFLFATLGMLRGTLTLPGIAGIVLTIGMAVDANVLVFERIREELRNGKSVRGAIDAGYGRAFVTILDANLTTLISAVVLFQFGTGPIKGFATTLMIGIIANLFTAVFVTRLIFDSVIGQRSVKKLSI